MPSSRDFGKQQPKSPNFWNPSTCQQTECRYWYFVFSIFHHARRQPLHCHQSKRFSSGSWKALDNNIFDINVKPNVNRGSPFDRVTNELSEYSPLKDKVSKRIPHFASISLISVVMYLIRNWEIPDNFTLVILRFVIEILWLISSTSCEKSFCKSWQEKILIFNKLLDQEAAPKVNQQDLLAWNAQWFHKSASQADLQLHRSCLSSYQRL